MNEYSDTPGGVNTTIDQSLIVPVTVNGTTCHLSQDQYDKKMNHIYSTEPSLDEIIANNK